MNFLIRAILLAVGISAALPAHAEGPTSEKLFRTFSSCDRAFFDELRKEHETWSRYMRLGTRGDVAYPIVQNRLREGQRIQMFDKPIYVGSVELVGYYDESSETVGVGKFTYWGFIAKGDVDSTVKKIRPYIVDGERLTKDEVGGWSRTERRYIGDPVDQWTKETIPSNSPPRAGSVERALLIDDNPELLGKDRVEIECTLQGTLTSALLMRLRPDLDEKEMP